MGGSQWDSKNNFNLFISNLISTHNIRIAQSKFALFLQNRPGQFEFFFLIFHFSEDKDSDGKEKKSKSKEKDKKKEPASMFQISGEKDSKSKKKGDYLVTTHKSKV